MIDPGKLKQVLYNFLSNALKFTPEGGSVTLRARVEGTEHFRLEVEDTGIGIRPEDIGRLFAEFQQLDASAAKEYAGTGLGLALTKRIVEAQGGRVGVTSVHGKGSVFHAVLPRQARAIGETPRAPRRVPRPGSPSLLVIEDDTRERAWLVETLTAAGYAVDVATTGAEAIELCAQRAFDGITLDLLLPDMGGWEVLKAIRGGGPNQSTPAVVVTVVIEKGVGAGYAIHDYLAKPVRAEELVASLHRAGLRPTTGRPVLVVDDDPQARRLLETMLRGLGYQTIEATGAEEGLLLAERETPAAVILDLYMPGMDGFGFLERFRAMAAGHGTPVIVWTGKDLTQRGPRAPGRVRAGRGPERRHGPADRRAEDPRRGAGRRRPRRRRGARSLVMAEARILVVDDNPANLQLLRMLLLGEAYDVRTAGDAAEALAVVSEFQPPPDPHGPADAGHGRLRADPPPEGRRRDARDRDRCPHRVRDEGRRGEGARRRLRRLRLQADRHPHPAGGHRTPYRGPRRREPASEAAGPCSWSRTTPSRGKMMRFALEARGSASSKPETASTALASATQAPPDLVLQDYVLPDMDGIQLIESLRTLPRMARTPVIVVTGLVSQLEALRRQAIEHTTFLPKPIEPSRLLDVVRAVLSGGSGAQGAGRRVLVVDDEPLNLKLAALRLRDAGFEVETARQRGGGPRAGAPSRPRRHPLRRPDARHGRVRTLPRGPRRPAPRRRPGRPPLLVLRGPGRPEAGGRHGRRRAAAPNFGSRATAIAGPRRGLPHRQDRGADRVPVRGPRG